MQTFKYFRSIIETLKKIVNFKKLNESSKNMIIKIKFIIIKRSIFGTHNTKNHVPYKWQLE